MNASSPSDTPSGRRHEGPKRSEASKQAVEQAAIKELAEHGWRRFSVDRVARTARASKQTIYRWWPRPAMLVVEATTSQLAEAVSVDGSPQEKIAAILKPLVDEIRGGDGAHLWRGVLLAAADDSDAGEIFRDWMAKTYKTPLRHILAELANKGMIRRDWDIELALELLLGPIWHRLIAMRGPVNERYPERLAEAVMTNMRPE